MLKASREHAYVGILHEFLQFADRICGVQVFYVIIIFIHNIGFAGVFTNNVHEILSMPCSTFLQHPFRVIKQTGVAFHDLQDQLKNPSADVEVMVESGGIFSRYTATFRTFHFAIDREISNRAVSAIFSYPSYFPSPYMTPLIPWNFF